jgi:hypothetical protein
LPIFDCKEEKKMPDVDPTEYSLGRFDRFCSYLPSKGLTNSDSLLTLAYTRATSLCGCIFLNFSIVSSVPPVRSSATAAINISLP